MDSIPRSGWTGILDTFSGHALWAVPLVLLGLQFLLKLVVLERPGSTRLFQNVIQVPVDVAFLALSFVAAAMIVPSEGLAEKVIVFVVYIALTVVAITLWKLSPGELTKERIIWTALLALINFTVTIAMLVGSILLLGSTGP